MDTSNASSLKPKAMPPMPKVNMMAVSVWGIAAFFYFYEVMLIVMPSVMIPELLEAFNANQTQIGLLSSYYFFAYAGMQIPVGLLMDKYGPRILLTIASALCGLGCLCLAAAEHLYLAYLGRLVMGIGGSFAVVGCLKLASLYFPLRYFAFLTGLMVAIGMMGAVMGQAPVSLLVSELGWRMTIFLGACLGFVFSLAIWVLMKFLDTQAEPNAVHRQLPPMKIFDGLMKVLRNKDVWVASIFAGLMYVPTTAFGDFWGIPYLEVKFAISRTEASAMIAMIFFGWAIGGPVYGWISDHIGLRRLPMGVAVGASTVLMLCILYLPPSKSMMTLLIFLLGVFSSGFILAFSVVRELNSPLITGTAIGFINTLNNASGWTQPLIGKVLDVQDATHVASQVTLYNNALVIIPGCLIVALLILPFVKETHCKPMVTHLD